ncbi:MAG: hypothetical protein SNJ61_03785 [Fimbriimonadaceae bacterium]
MACLQPPAPRPRRHRNFWPIALAAGALGVGLATAAFVGAWVYRTTQQRVVEPDGYGNPIVVERHEDGWVTVRFDDLGLTMDLPSVPETEPGDYDDAASRLTLEQAALYRSETGPILAYVFGYRYRPLAVPTLGDAAGATADWIASDIRWPVKKTSSRVEFIGKPAESGTVSYQFANERYAWGYVTVLQGLNEFTIAVLDTGQSDPANLATFARIKRSVVQHDRRAPIARASEGKTVSRTNEAPGRD